MRRRERSITAYLSWGLALGLILLMTLLGWLLGSRVEQLAIDLTQTRLQHDGEALLAAVEFDADGAATLPEEHSDAIYKRPFSGHYFLILQQQQPPIRSRSLWDAPLAAEHLSQGESLLWQTNGPSDQPLLVWSAGYRKQGRELTVVVAEDLSALHKSLWQLQLWFAGMTLGVLALMLIWQRYIVRRAMTPLEQVRQELKRLEQGEIATLAESVPGEVRPLVLEVNRLLRLMGERLQRSRNASGNLAHALKTPLNLIQQLAEHEALVQQPQLRRELIDYAQRIHRLIEQELKRARLAGGGGTGQRFTPAEELPELCELLKRIHRDKALTLHCHADAGLLLPYDRDDMLELLGNLLDNACKWARAEVNCRFDDHGAGVELTIEDDGPGIAADKVAAITQRGARLDEQTEGHGLGLAIVQDIARLYGAQIQFDRSPQLGGLRVRVQFSRG